MNVKKLMKKEFSKLSDTDKNDYLEFHTNSVVSSSKVSEYKKERLKTLKKELQELISKQNKTTSDAESGRLQMRIDKKRFRINELTYGKDA